MKTRKTFDCVAMKRRAQERIREILAGKSHEEEIAFFQSGAEEFKKQIAAARAALSRNDPSN